MSLYRNWLSKPSSNAETAAVMQAMAKTRQN